MTHIRYFAASLLALTEQTPDGRWIAELPGAPGVWFDAGTEQEALDGLPDVLRGWWWLKTDDGDPDLPPSNWTFSNA